LQQWYQHDHQDHTNHTIRVNGNFSIRLKNGSDGNTLLDECGFVTPAGSTLPFTTKNITTAGFQTAVNGGCKYDTVYFTHNAYGGTTQWQWSIDGTVISTQQNPAWSSKALVRIMFIFCKQWFLQ
jgi:PKD repeat protein